MKQEKTDVSPFASLSFSRQQDKWREWRSQQLEYKKAADETPLPEEKQEEHLPEKPLLPSRPAPTRHRELDQVLSRHQAALRRAGVFQVTKGSDPPGK